jgi:hypothetical protein
MTPIERYGSNEEAESKDPDELNIRDSDELTLRT